MLDLDYAEDSQPMTDANFVLTGKGGIVEIQATAEDAPFDEAQFAAMLGLARAGIGELTRRQRAALGLAAPMTLPDLRGERLVIASHNPARSTKSSVARAVRLSRRSPPARSASPSRRRPATASRPMPR